MIFITNFWYSNSLISKFLSIILFPISLIWIMADSLKKLISRPYKSKIKIICVGNLNIGGSGKTPFCITLFKCLQNLSFNPVFLSGGYKSKANGPVEVNFNSNKNQFGDEALILAKVGPTIISKNRYLGVKFIENHECKFDVIIMDDGLQNYQVFKNIKLLTLDRKSLFGNRFCIPAGPLRQTISSCIKSIDAIVFTGNKGLKPENFNSSNFSFNSYIHVNLGGFDFKNIKFLAFCGIANPDKFYKTLELTNINVKKKINFSDHYNYNKNDINKLIRIAKKNNLKLITTEKDIVKIEKKFHKIIHFLPIEIKMSRIETEKFRSFLSKKLND